MGKSTREAYDDALKAGDVLLEAAYTEIGRKSEVSETSKLYARNAYCLLQLKQPKHKETLLILEQGKTRLLAEALSLGNVELNTLSEKQRQDMINARNRVHELESEMRLPPDTQARRSDAELGTLLAKASKELQLLIKAIRKTHPDFMPKGIDLSDILALLPLHAAWREIDGRKQTFLDDYTVSYAPSAYALHVSQQRLQDERRLTSSLFTVVNPTGDLRYAPAECKTISSLFTHSRQKNLKEHNATKEAVKDEVPGYTYLHFSCHGFYDWQDAMRSGLVLANGETLTLADIISQLDLNTSRLVTMSACETGLTEFQQSPDEYIGLPAGFMQAGAPGIISTLWAVDDLSTMLLMERFYTNHLSGMSLPVALQKAQLWLRDVTAGNLTKRFDEERNKTDHECIMSVEDAKKAWERFDSMEPDVQPFSNPLYWAAFTYTGV